MSPIQSKCTFFWSFIILPHPHHFSNLNFIPRILNFTMQINAYQEGTEINTEVNARPLKNIGMHRNTRHRWFQRVPISVSLALQCISLVSCESCHVKHAASSTFELGQRQSVSDDGSRLNDKLMTRKVFNISHRAASRLYTLMAPVTPPTRPRTFAPPAHLPHPSQGLELFIYWIRTVCSTWVQIYNEHIKQ